MGVRRPRGRLFGAGLVLRRELDHGFFSATWKLPVSFSSPSSLSSIYLVPHPILSAWGILWAAGFCNVVLVSGDLQGASSQTHKTRHTQYFWQLASC